MSLKWVQNEFIAVQNELIAVVVISDPILDRITRSRVRSSYPGWQEGTWSESNRENELAGPWWIHQSHTCHPGSLNIISDRAIRFRIESFGDQKWLRHIKVQDQVILSSKRVCEFKMSLNFVKMSTHLVSMNFIWTWIRIISKLLVVEINPV